jgi:hypothetical protein
MNRLLTSIAGLVLLGFASLCTTATHAAEKPNIVFIFADDWGCGDLSCHGQPQTPVAVFRQPRQGKDLDRAAGTACHSHRRSPRRKVRPPNKLGNALE